MAYPFCNCDFCYFMELQRHPEYPRLFKLGEIGLKVLMSKWALEDGYDHLGRKAMK